LKVEEEEGREKKSWWDAEKNRRAWRSRFPDVKSRMLVLELIMTIQRKKVIIRRKAVGDIELYSRWGQGVL